MTSRTWYLLGCAAAIISTTSSPAQAEFVIFDSGVTLSSDGGQALLNSDSSANGQFADRFILDTAAVLNRVQWSGTPGSTQDSFTIQILSSVDGKPGAPLHPINAVGAGSPSLWGPYDYGYDIYTYSADINDTPLGPGEYYISISNHTGPGWEDDWYWIAEGRTEGTVYDRTLDQDSWTKYGGWVEATADFTLISFSEPGSVTPVPEPASLATLAFCVTIGCGGAHRLWKRRTTGQPSPTS